tara:strand:- start:182 stop:898 length:717 start_codon:yes stop_codon:yes gene_type:complete
MADKLTHKEVWETLSKVDCSEHIEKKMNLSYLSWAWAWGVLMEHYADAQFTFQAFTDSDEIMRDAMFYPDGSASVHVTVSIGSLTRSMWLPVMDYKNNAISNPSARQISDAKMRCLVKAIALFGLGHYIYAGEDLPSQDKKETKEDSGSADAPNNENKSPTSDESAESKEDVVDDKFIEIVETFIKDVKSVESLESFWKENAKEFKRMKEGQEATYNGLLESFAKIKSELTNEEKKDG